MVRCGMWHPRAVSVGQFDTSANVVLHQWILCSPKHRSSVKIKLMEACFFFCFVMKLIFVSRDTTGRRTAMRIGSTIMWELMLEEIIEVGGGTNIH